MKKIIKSALLAVLVLAMTATAFVGCGNNKKKILIYTSLEDYRLEYMQKKLNEKFPEYNIVMEYLSSGEHAAKLLAAGEAGKNIDCDISYNLEYGYAEKLQAEGVFADLKDISDFSVFVDDLVQSTYYLPQERNSGAIILNNSVIEKKQLDVPTSYEDLLDPQYKGLISMPDPKSSGTGYMFYLYLVNTWGEEKALEYFDKLAENVLQFTASGSGPVNSLLEGEVAIGLGMLAPAVTEITDGADLQVVFFEEGAPYSAYAQAIIAGKEEDEDVLKVFEYLSTELTVDNNEMYFPESLYKDKNVVIANFPQNIKYGDMSNNTADRKEDLLSKWGK